MLICYYSNLLEKVVSFTGNQVLMPLGLGSLVNYLPTPLLLRSLLLHLCYRLVSNHMLVKVGAAAIYSGRLLPFEFPTRRQGVLLLSTSHSAFREHSLRRTRKRQLLSLQNAAEIAAGTRMRVRRLLALLKQRAQGAREGRFYDRARRLLALQRQGAHGAREGRQ